MAHILIVDDSPTEVHVLTNLLKKYGHEASAAANAEEGMAKAKSTHPDLILMDVVMPGMNGFQATRQLTRDPDTQKIPVIIVTTKDQDTDKVWGMRQGACAYLTKPVAEQELLGKIKAALGS
jgi:twitching motility two-component system response regulator PilH